MKFTMLQPGMAILMVLALMAGGAQAAQQGPVAPQAVTLFPAGAMLQVQQTLPVDVQADGQRGVVLYLPIQAEPETLRLSPESGVLSDVQWESVPGTDQDAVEAMRKELAALQRELAGLAGDVQAMDARIALWTEAPVTASAAAELERLDAAMGKHLQALYRARHDADVKRQKAEEAVRRLQDQLNAATGGDEQMWRVRVAVADAPASLAMSYTYRMRDCGWEPVYRIEATPANGIVHLGFDAALTQASGMDWRNAAITLATVERYVSLEPPYLPEWVISKQESVVQDAVMAEAAPMRMSLMAKGAPAADMARKVERGTYAAWELGKRSIPAGRRVVLPVLAEEWHVGFRYTVRPASDDKAYLTASATLTEAHELPQGMAMFMVDGALIGKRPFSLSGTDATLFFGADPMVTATRTLQDDVSGSKGVISRRQSRVWAWSTTVLNHRGHPVTVRVEEAQPRSAHEDITIEMAATPKATGTEDHTLFWTLQLEPGGSETIAYSVSVQAPKDMDVDFGVPLR